MKPLWQKKNVVIKDSEDAIIIVHLKLAKWRKSDFALASSVARGIILQKQAS
jgi:hypothetical protein